MEHLFVNSNNVVKRNTSVCYYDCTNYFFECEKEDDAYVDPVTGEVFRGLRKYGPSKEHRPTPIVQTVHGWQWDSNLHVYQSRVTKRTAQRRSVGTQNNENVWL